MTARRPRRRRWVLRAGVCVVLGAVTTVGVAWGFTLAWSSSELRTLANPERVEWPLGRDGGPTFWCSYEPVPETWPPIQRAAASWGLGADAVLVTGYQEPDGPGAEQWTMRAGWPMRALYLGRSYRYWPFILSDWTLPPWGFPLDDCPLSFGVPIPDVIRAPPAYQQYPHGSQYLPICPLWRGFIVNTLAFAAAWWLLFIAPGASKRWRRKRRGACLACGYDLRGLAENAICPECGR